MIAPSAGAELIADRGRAASSEEEFFRSPQFLEAEGVTHTLRIESAQAELLAPVIVRQIGAGPDRDATSPYGYPGLSGDGGPALEPSVVSFSSTGLVSLFIRHRLDRQPLAGARPRNVVQLADPSLPPKSRMSDRQQIRRNLGRGYELRLISGPRSSAAERAGFQLAYEQTMRRADAAPRYFFGPAYFDLILSFEWTWLALALAPEGQVAAGSIAVRSDHVLHYFLSGSSDAHLRDSPMKNILSSLTELSRELDLPLNLGGGIRPGDRLEEFKRGFANREQPWYTSEIICDPLAYRRLAPAGGGSGDFFPAYRAD